MSVEQETKNVEKRCHMLRTYMIKEGLPTKQMVRILQLVELIQKATMKAHKQILIECINNESTSRGDGNG